MAARSINKTSPCGNISPMGEFGRFRWLPTVLLVCGLVHAGCLLAQAPDPTPEGEKSATNGQPTTLHLFADLVQMPVLVLSADRQRVPVIKPERFSMSIDNGPRFQPKYVRPEGADPISLTIVLDFGGEAAELIPKIGEAIDRVTPQGLTPRDHVSLLLMQCGLTDVLNAVPAEPGLLQPKIADASKAWAARDRKKPCEEDFHLWDTLLTAALRLSDAPGRRVIIAVTDGKDRGSKHLPEEVASEMHTFAVTTFAVKPLATDIPMSAPDIYGITLVRQTTPGAGDESLERLCELSGGVGLIADRATASKELAHIPQLVRDRYILEFPRPSNTTAGGHKFDVKVARSDDFIRSSGTSIPLPDPKAGDPTPVQMGKTKTAPHLFH